VVAGSNGVPARAFGSSCAYLVGMLASVAFGLHPYVLPASTNLACGLTVENAEAPDYGLRIGLIWWMIGMVLATGYSVFSYRRFAGKVSSAAEEEGY
jgi:cytochrome d ubiquinol oxidase subunit II